MKEKLKLRLRFLMIMGENDLLSFMRFILLCNIIFLLMESYSKALRGLYGEKKLYVIYCHLNGATKI